MKALFTTTSSSVLLNGVPGKRIYIRRGVRQGDPYSPLIFVLAADLLQSILNKSMRLNQITAPLQVNTCPHFPIVQYADDTLVVMQADSRQLFCLKALLNTFATATGLKVNYGKSIMVPMNIAEDMVEIFTNTLQCARGHFPFTYLWSSLGNIQTNYGAMPPPGKQDCQKTGWYLCLHDPSWKITTGQVSDDIIVSFLHVLSGHTYYNKETDHQVLEALSMERP
jgi:hypothetical protein